MRANIAPWAIRVAIIVSVAAGFNYWLHSQASPANAGGSQKYAKIEHVGFFGQYLGIQGDVLVGDPYPCSPSNCAFSNQTLWAGKTSGCAGPSWVETGWYKGYHHVTGVFGWYYKFIYKVPGTNGCTYTEAPLGGTPQIGTAPNYRLEWHSGTQWRMYWLGFHIASVTTGWKYADDVQAGGEVGFSGTGMDGGVNNIKHRRQLGPGPGWTAITINDPQIIYTCDFGYTLVWSGTDDIRDAGYGGPGSCPQ